MKPLANRLSNLGTESAFLVSLDAAKLASTGKEVFPFHLGDIDIPTPQNIVDSAKESLDNGKTGYCPAAGIMELKEALAKDIGEARNVKYTTENVVVQPGGKPVITKFLQALMNKGDGVLYPNPGYPIYESQVEYLGGISKPYGYTFSESGFSLNRDQIESQIDENTKIFIYNNYQNPLGAESSQEEMQWVADIANKYDLWVLADDAYFDMVYSGKPRSIVNLPGMYERTVILYTFSKKYAMTGWRLGAAIGPVEIMKTIAKLNTNDESCTSHFTQYAGIEALNGNQSGYKNILSVLEKRKNILIEKLKEIDGVTVYNPNSTFYLFPEITPIYKKMGATSLEEFRTKTLEATGVSFCTREHFGSPLDGEDKKFIRFAYSGISVKNIEKGMEKLKKYWKNL